MSAYRLTESGHDDMENLRDGLSALAALVLWHDSGDERSMSIPARELWVLIDCLQQKAAKVLSSAHFIRG